MEFSVLCQSAGRCTLEISFLMRYLALQFFGFLLAGLMHFYPLLAFCTLVKICNYCLPTMRYFIVRSSNFGKECSNTTLDSRWAHICRHETADSQDFINLWAYPISWTNIAPISIFYAGAYLAPWSIVAVVTVVSRWLILSFVIRRWLNVDTLLPLARR